MESSGPEVLVVVLKSVKATNSQIAPENRDISQDRHEAACNIATKARNAWQSDIVLVLISEQKQFCASSAAPPAGLPQTEIDDMQAVAEKAMEMGLVESALTFSLLRIQSLLGKADGAAVAVRRPTPRELVQASLISPKRPPNAATDRRPPFCGCARPRSESWTRSSRPRPAARLAAPPRPAARRVEGETPPSPHTHTPILPRWCRQVFVSSMLPFIGFGVLDNGLMIVYGAPASRPAGRRRRRRRLWR